LSIFVSPLVIRVYHFQTFSSIWLGGYIDETTGKEYLPKLAQKVHTHNNSNKGLNLKIRKK
jgi:hypothetical protein